MTYRDIKGRFTKFDRRKYLFDNEGKSVYVPHVGNVSKDVRHPTKAQILLKEHKIKSNVIDTITFTDRGKDQDLYKYFANKKLNQRIARLKKKYPKKVLVAVVHMTIGKRRFQTTQFKITDFTSTRFIGGKRKGRKYTAKDQIAYFIHDRINNSNYTLYRNETDHTAQVRNHAKPQKNRGRYNSRQRFDITIKAISKTTSKRTPSVGDIPKVRKKKRFNDPESLRKIQLSTTNKRRSRKRQRKTKR